MYQGQTRQLSPARATSCAALNGAPYHSSQCTETMNNCFPEIFRLRSPLICLATAVAWQLRVRRRRRKMTRP